MTPAPQPASAQPAKPQSQEEEIGQLVTQFLKQHPQWKQYLPPQAIDQLKASINDPDSANKVVVDMLSNALKGHLKTSGFVGKMGMKMMRGTLMNFLPPGVKGLANQVLDQVAGTG